jgi:uncharacterized membrane protein YhiD involved in acid resistance
MISEGLFIATISALLVIIGWLVIVLFKNKDRTIKNEEKNEQLERNYNKLVLDVATMYRDFEDKLDEQNITNNITQKVIHEVTITLTKLDTTLNHFNKTLDRLTDDLSDQKEMIDNLRFKANK